MNTMSNNLTAASQHPVVREVQKVAQGLGADVYLVGGAVRDWLLTGQTPLDLDFMVINGDAAQLAQMVSEVLNGRSVPLDPEFGIYRVVVFQDPVLTLDFSNALENSIEKDLARRDLTINAMAMDFATYQLLDPFGGQEDLKDKRIRMVSEANLVDDPLRMLRVFRIAATIQAMTIDKETLEAVARNRELLWQSAGERIQYEFFRLLSVKYCFSYLKLMADCGLLEVVIPELKATREIPPNAHHHLWLFDHTLELVRQAERLINEIPEPAQAHILQSFNGVVTRFGLLKVACLLHDIGKPATMEVKDLAEGEAGRKVTFYGHDKVSEDLSEEVLKRLKTSKEVKEFVKKLVRWHLYPCQFGPESSRKSVLRFFRRMAEETPDVTLLALADRHSTKGPEITDEILNASHQKHLWLLKRYDEEQETLQLPRLLTGHDVMNLLNLKPGPEIREVLDALQEAQQLGEVTTPDEAKAWVKTQFKSF